MKRAQQLPPQKINTQQSPLTEFYKPVNRTLLVLCEILFPVFFCSLFLFINSIYLSDAAFIDTSQFVEDIADFDTSVLNEGQHDLNKTKGFLSNLFAAFRVTTTVRPTIVINNQITIDQAYFNSTNSHVNS